MSYPNEIDLFVAKVDNFDDVMAADINELQTSIMASQAYFGTQIQFGWLPLPTCTYVSPTSFTLPGNLTSFLKIGTRFRCENGPRKYGYVLNNLYSIDLNRTTVNLVPNTSYVLAAGGITGAYISYANPPDFPDWLSWAPTFTGYSSAPTGGVYRFKVDGRQVTAVICEPNNGTSNLSSLTMTSPLTAATITNALWMGAAAFMDNGGALTNWGNVRISTVGSSFVFGINPSVIGGFTSSGYKRVIEAQIVYEI